jgi:hypothetical protein
MPSTFSSKVERGTTLADARAPASEVLDVKRMTLLFSTALAAGLKPQVCPTGAPPANGFCAAGKSCKVAGRHMAVFD